MKLICHLLFTTLLLASCVDEQAAQHSVQRLDISFADTPLARSTWADRTDSEGGTASYIWENNTNMLTAIKHDGQYVPFYENMSDAAQYHSMTRFETVDAEQSKIRLHTTLGVKYDYDAEQAAYEFPVAAGDLMFCCHPVDARTSVGSDAAGVSVKLPIPSTFSYTKCVNDLSSLGDYSYVYTSTTLQTVDANSIVASASPFRSACAIVRFNVTNGISSDIMITGIKMEAADGSRIFPNVLGFSEGTLSEQADRTGYYSRLTTDIQGVTIPRTQTGVFYNMCFPLDGDFNHVPLKFTVDTNYLTYQLHLDSDVITNRKFEAGKLYTFNFILEEKEIRLNTIDISQCTTYNVDKAESLNIIVSPDAIWQQTASESAQMVFVSLGMTTTIDGKDYDVLWATCNLGAMEPIGTGNHYAWGEVGPKAASLYSPEGYISTASSDIHNTSYDAVKTYLGGGHWLWCMPTKDMWDDLIEQCTWTWKTVKKVDDGEATEENLDFDSSVWEVKKTNANGKLEGIIYFPITGYSGREEGGDTYGKVKKARCCYWTSTPSGDAAGATAKSWAFVTTYYIETSSGDGHMSDHTQALQECERYNGYSIRPVLLKERNN